MKNIAYIVSIFFCVLSISACNSTRSGIPKNDPFIIIEGETYTEVEYGKFITWRCKDPLEEYGKTIVEVGLVDNPELQDVGFILYDGTNVGSFTIFSRQGVDRKWSWGGEDMVDYAITINPAGDGFYFDFRGIEPGETTMSRDSYHCYQ